MPRFGFLFAVGLAGVTLVLIDCGLDESGIVPGGNDGAVTIDAGADVQDAGQPDVVIPPTCSTIDASCLVAAVPTGWSLLGVASGTASCPSADFDPVALVENPRLRADSCTCGGCTTSGGYVCNGFTLKAGASCAAVTITKTGISAQCVTTAQSGSGGFVAVTPSSPSGTPSCSIASTGTGAVDTDPVTGCRPNKCEADFCGVVNSGFATCIVHDGVAACPSGFSPRGTTGRVGASGTVSCASCGCTVNNPATCTGIFRVFDNVGDCDGDGGTNGNDYRGVYPADGGCNNVGNFNSIFYVPDPAPTAACSPAAPAPVAGDAGLSSVKTICCAP